MKNSIRIIVLILVLSVSMLWAETAEEWFKKGKEAFLAEKYDRAITCYKKAITIDPNYAKAHYNLGVVYDKKGVVITDKAIAEYKKALAIDPGNVRAHNNLGVLYYKKDMFDEAISEYKKIIVIDPDYVKAHYNLGIVYGNKGAYTLADDHFYKAGMLYLEQGDREKALKAYGLLRKTDSKQLERTLLEKLYPELQKKKE